VSFSFQQRVTVTPDVLCRLIGGEAVLLNLKTKSYVGLNPVATRMWKLLQESPSVEHAYEVLLDEYDVEGDQLRHDLDKFVHDLVRQELIELRRA
jgi:hypothetical protein